MCPVVNLTDEVPDFMEESVEGRVLADASSPEGSGQQLL